VGELAEAVTDVRAALGLLSRARSHDHNPVTTRHRAHLTTLLGEQYRPDEATNLLLEHEHADPYARPPGRVETADFLLARGRLWAATGDHEAAVADYAACGRLLETWAITNPAVMPWRSHAALALAATGELDEAIRHADEDSLTRSEHNIALMALASKTNREIAQRLYLQLSHHVDYLGHYEFIVRR
jgi:hypothetical protein